MFFTIPNLFERMIDEPVSVVGVLSVTAIITTISLFFCGIPICLEIWNRRSTDEISGFPFLMGFLGGAFWLRYGLLKSDLTMIIVNTVGVSLMFLYLIFYLYYTRSRGVVLFEMTVVMASIGAMIVLVAIYGESTIDQLGFVCMTFNIINFGAPLAGIAVVFRKRSCDSLPLPLCSANLLVSSQWCVYGILVQDKYIIIPNGAGIVLALLQISLFLVFPRREGTRAPLALCCACLDDLERREKQDFAVDSSAGMRNGFVVNGGFAWPAQYRFPSRDALPPSRNACIEFLRSNAFSAGGYYVYPEGGSTRSRVTAASGETSTTSITAASNLSAVSSVSHPELWQASQAALTAVAATAATGAAALEDTALENGFGGGGGGANFDAFNCSYNSGSVFNCSRNSGIVNPLAASNSSCTTQYFQSLWAGASASGRQSLQQLQQLQLQLQQQQLQRQQQQQQQQQQQNQQPQQQQRPPSQQEHLLSRTQFEFDRIRELDELDRQWMERELKRTLSAPDLSAAS